MASSGTNDIYWPASHILMAGMEIPLHTHLGIYVQHVTTSSQAIARSMHRPLLKLINLLQLTPDLYVGRRPGLSHRQLYHHPANQAQLWTCHKVRRAPPTFQILRLASDSLEHCGPTCPNLLDGRTQGSTLEVDGPQDVPLASHNNFLQQHLDRPALNMPLDPNVNLSFNLHHLSEEFQKEEDNTYTILRYFPISMPTTTSISG